MQANSPEKACGYQKATTHPDGLPLPVEQELYRHKLLDGLLVLCSKCLQGFRVPAAGNNGRRSSQWQGEDPQCILSAGAPLKGICISLTGASGTALM